MTAAQIQNALVLCLILGFAAMEWLSRRYARPVTATAKDTKLELFMFLSLLGDHAAAGLPGDAQAGRLAGPG